MTTETDNLWEDDFCSLQDFIDVLNIPSNSSGSLGRIAAKTIERLIDKEADKKKMADIGDLVKELVDDDLKYQLLNASIKAKEIKGRKGDKYSQITFLAETERMNDDQEAIIIWTTPDKFNKALAKAKAS